MSDWTSDSETKCHRCGHWNTTGQGCACLGVKKTQRSFNSTIRKSGLPKKTNPARRRKEFARTYHSEERVLFVKGLPCAACGIVGFSENAHIENGGMSRKGPYTSIIPLCGPHPTDMNRAGITTGHHQVMDRLLGREEFERIYAFNLAYAAAETEAAWQASLGSAPGGQT